MTISGARARNKEKGHYFFSPETMRFFGSRVESSLLRGGHFITSEFTGFDRISREYKVRQFDYDSGDVTTVSRSFKVKEDARVYARLLA